MDFGLGSSGSGAGEALRHKGARGQSAAADDESAEPVESTASSGCGSLTALCPTQRKGRLLMAEKANVLRAIEDDGARPVSIRKRASKEAVR